MKVNTWVMSEQGKQTQHREGWSDWIGIKTEGEIIKKVWKKSAQYLISGHTLRSSLEIAESAYMHTQTLKTGFRREHKMDIVSI